jgi:heavy metal translocating P-type ATPase
MARKHHRKISTFSLINNPFIFWFDLVLVVISIAAIASSIKSILLFVAIIGLLPVLWSALKSLLNKHVTIDLLASMALIFAILSSEFQSAVLISLMLVSARFLAYFTESRTKQAIQKLLKLKPTEVLVKSGAGIIKKKIEDVSLGDLIIITSGERIAVDGTVVEGIATIDQSSLTGESEPVVKRVGDQVLSTTLNVTGSLVVKTEKVGADTTFSKILKLIEESQKGKAPISSRIDKFVVLYIVATILVTFFVYIATKNLSLVLSILLVTCADDLAIAIPLAFVVTIGTAAKKGIIIKGASFIEGLTKIKLMLFDKTGTITEGKAKIKGVFVFKGFTDKIFFSLLGGLVVESKHPTDRAIYEYIKQNNYKISSIERVNEVVGFGISGYSNEKKIHSGNLQYLKKCGIGISKEQAEVISKEKNIGRMIVGLAVGDLLAGIISLSDSVRPHAAHVIGELKKLGVERIVILTGDNEIVASQVAEEIGVNEFQANLLPKGKVEFIKKSISNKYKVAMVGDGVNDAASLALVDVGFAMGTIGSDVSIEAADVALMKDDLKNIVEAIQMSKKTMKIINQDLILWGAINIIGLTLVFAGVLSPVTAAAYNFLTDLLPPLNSLRLLGFSHRVKNGKIY